MVRILFFARLREQLGVGSTEIELATSQADLNEVKKIVSEKLPGLEQELSAGKVLCAVNQEMVSGNPVIRAGDEVAFFPPVTGG